MIRIKDPKTFVIGRWVLGMTILLILIQTSYAFEYGPPENANIIITKSDITPVPAAPGKDLLLEVLIENNGQSEAKNVSIEIKPDPKILLKNEDERVTYKESFCTFCRLAKTYYLHVDSRAVSGVYEIEIKATRGGEIEVIKTINVTVRGKPQLTISDVKIMPGIITPESNLTLDFSVTNKGTGIASAISVKTILDDVPFIPVGVNSLVIEKLSPNSSRRVQYNLFAKKIASGGYSLPIQLKYENENNENFSSKEFVGIRVVGKAKLNIANIKTDPNKIISGNDITLMVRIENSGTGDARSVKADIGLPFQGTKTAFLGKIDPDEDAPAVFNLKASKAGDYKYNLTIQYEDDLGEHEYKQDLDIVVYDTTGNSGIIVVLGIIIILGVVYFGYRWLRKR